jgi:hypothetical protein
MNEYWSTTCLKISKLHTSWPSRYLKQQSWGQQNKQHNWHKHWAPVRHVCFLVLQKCSVFCVVKCCCVLWDYKLDEFIVVHVMDMLWFRSWIKNNLLHLLFAIGCFYFHLHLHLCGFEARNSIQGAY